MVTSVCVRISHYQNREAYHILTNIHFSRTVIIGLLVCLLTACNSSSRDGADAPTLPALDDSQLEWLGERIFTNECRRQPRCLTAWNAGEDFPSLGIGHFIWYREGQQAIFEESFPALLDYLRRQGASPPAWLDDNPHNPWPDRENFLDDLDGPRLTGLRDYLMNTLPGQTGFILHRFESSLPALLEDDPTGILRSHLLAIANSQPPYGLYALIDYSHFKGTGLSPTERYQGEGWGLLQVLQQMAQSRANPYDTDAGTVPLADFTAAARRVLTRRVTNAPPQRNETRWLAGWQARLDTYITDQNDHADPGQ